MIDSGRQVDSRAGEPWAAKKSVVWYTVMLMAVGWTLLPCAADNSRTVSVKRSDVVVTRPPWKPALHEQQYGATFLAWGFLPAPSREGGDRHTEEWRSIVNAVHAAGARFQGRIELDAGWRGMIDYDPNFMESVCRTLDGAPITSPWFWDKSYKGNPAYWFCTNSPQFRGFMKHEVAAALSVDVDALMIDAQTSTLSTLRMGGCFCRWCMKGFGKYLRDHAPPGVLARHRVTDLEQFDYGRYLRGRRVNAQTFARMVYRRPPVIPFAEEYVSFQYTASGSLVEEFRRCVEREAGRPLPISSSAPLTWPHQLYAIPHVTFLCSELYHESFSRQPPREVLFSYKLTEAFDRPLICTALPRQDWATVKRENRPGLVRTWIAQAYAFGVNFMVPDRMWCYGDQREGVGTHWYESKPGDYDFLYRFVRQHADLLDGYDALAHVGLVYSNRAVNEVRDTCISLALDNVPFQLVVAGDGWLPNRLEYEDLRGFKAIVVPVDLVLDANQQTMLNMVRHRTVVGLDRKRLFELVPRQVTVESASGITVVPRANKSDAHAPFVCHLVNRNYVPSTDSMRVQKDFTITVADSLFGVGIERATLYAPGREPVECEVRRLASGTRIAIPELDIWAILKLTGSQT